MTDYHILRNKRFILTNQAAASTTAQSASESTKSVQLWSVETGTVVKQWQSKNFQQVQ